jgi:hypothetical protein
MVLLTKVAMLALVLIVWLVLRWLIHLVWPGAGRPEVGSTAAQRRVARVAGCASAANQRVVTKSAKSLRRHDAHVHTLHTSR